VALRPVQTITTGKEVLMPHQLFDWTDKLYVGPRTLSEMRDDVRIAYTIYYAQKKRKGVRYKFREFCYWYVKNLKKKTWEYPHVGRIDHSKPYSFDNIVMQEITENSIERNARLGNPGKTHRKVKAKSNGKIFLFPTKQAAAAHFKVSEKTIYNHCQKRTTQHFRFGPKTGRTVRFSWND